MTTPYHPPRNEANGEGGADGHRTDYADIFGHEGPEAGPEIDAARLRRAKAMLATTMLAQGVPMLQAGDEFGRSQHGNNNAYCQDNETSWVDWSATRPELQAAVRDLIAFRTETAPLAHPRFGRDEGDDRPRLSWLHPRGTGMEEGDWHDGALKLFALELFHPSRGRQVMIFNAGGDGEFSLPGGVWRHVIDTSASVIRMDSPVDGVIPVPGQSVQVLVASDD